MRDITITKQDGTKVEGGKAFEGTLVSIAAEPSANSNGTVFYRGTVQAEHNGVKQNLPVKIYQGTLDRADEADDKIEVGTKRLCTLEPWFNENGEQRFDIRLSHLYYTAADAKTIMDFFGIEQSEQSQVTHSELVADEKTS